ncbi:MAG: LamG-like jellyroll fold domain-containing protein [Ignavibacteria bacterium]
MKIIKKILSLIILLLQSFIYSQQIDINRIEQMPNIPNPFEMRDWKKTALGYDSLVFNFDLSGDYLPLIQLNTATVNYPNHNSFLLNTVVGTTSPGSGEAINVLPAVIGASLAGIDKSNQNGNNFVLMCEEWFNKNNGELVYLNHPSSSTGDDWWYETMPNVFFYQLYDLYPGTGDFNFQFIKVADRWLQAVDSMGGNTAPWQIPYMNYRAWNLKTMEPLSTGVPEPEAAGSIAWILYNAFNESGNEKYRIGAEWAMEFLNSWSSNPSYELQLGYGVYTAARMNAELNTDYNIEKLINWCFEIGDLRKWGSILGNWGGYDVYGLIGESISNDYAFIMNTFELGGALVPLVRYDDRFARAIGKWMLNAANASRLFYTNYLPDNHQDSEGWSHQYDPNSYIAHEALRETENSVSPYATGDAISGGWGLTNLALYGSSHVGIFGGIIDTANIPGILKLDLLKTDYFHKDAYPSFLFYNPYDSAKDISMNIGGNLSDIYDAVSNSILKSNVTGETEISIPADAAVITVIIPAGGIITYDLNKVLVNGIVVDYNSGQGVINYPPRIKSLAAKPGKILLNASSIVYCSPFDKDVDSLTFIWSAEEGAIDGNGSEVNYRAPNFPGSFKINCIIEDNKGGKDSAKIIIEVVEFLNQNPRIEKIKASPRKIDLGKESDISCFASDDDNDELNYLWSASSGDLTGSGSSISWEAPQIPGNYFIVCSVDDGKGGFAEDSTEVEVRDFSIVQTGEITAFYPFNGNANDESGNGNNGFVYQAALTNDRFRNSQSAYFFDGVNDYIQIQNSPVINFQNSITLNFWMIVGNFYSDREAYPISHGNWENRWKISITDKKIRWTIKTAAGTKDLDSETELTLDSLYNVTAVYDGSDIEVYLNGELDAFSNFSGDILTTNIDLIFGQNLPGNNNYNFNGVLDDIRIYNYALPYNQIQELYDIGTDVNSKSTSDIPAENILYQNYPNPFNGESVIRFYLKKRMDASISIYDILGRKIKSLSEKEFNPGYHSLTWNSLNDNGKDVSSGIYFYELKTRNFSIRKKLVLIR